MFDILKNFIFNENAVITETQTQILTIGSVCLSIVFVFMLITLFYKVIHSIF